MSEVYRNKKSERKCQTLIPSLSGIKLDSDEKKTGTELDENYKCYQQLQVVKMIMAGKSRKIQGLGITQTSSLSIDRSIHHTEVGCRFTNKGRTHNYIVSSFLFPSLNGETRKSVEVRGCKGHLFGSQGLSQLNRTLSKHPNVAKTDDDEGTKD